MPGLVKSGKPMNHGARNRKPLGSGRLNAVKKEGDAIPAMRATGLL
jgi:hypothetical protein